MITYNGVDIQEEFGCRVVQSNAESAPAREYASYDIPGRSGSLLIDQKQYRNVTVTYLVVFYFDAESSYSRFKNFMLSQVGYQRLEDSSRPNEYRMAAIEQNFDATLSRTRSAIKLNVEFDCKPQRFLTTGETVVEFTENGSIDNETYFDAEPLIRVYGSGTLLVGTTQITIEDADVYTDIDCDAKDCYKGLVNKNANVSFSGHKFPVLSPGVNEIAFAGGITKVEITPRWWKL